MGSLGYAHHSKHHDILLANLPNVFYLDADADALYYLRQWIEDNLYGRYAMIRTDKLKIYLETDDALAFKMRWQ